MYQSGPSLHQQALSLIRAQRPLFRRRQRRGVIAATEPLQLDVRAGGGRFVCLDPLFELLVVH